MAFGSFAAELMRLTMYSLYQIFIKKLEIEEPSNLYFAAGVELLFEAFLFNVVLTYFIYS